MMANEWGGNSMLNLELKFHWTATFKDGSEISQYDADGKEHPFKEVLENSSNLVSFYIVHSIKPLKITVDLTRGLLFINTQQQDVGKELQEEKSNIRLVFFRRHTVKLTQELLESGHNIVYFIGYQYNDKSGINHKVLLQVDQDGNITIGDN
jgi:hypothetical protein